MDVNDDYLGEDLAEGVDVARKSQREDGPSTTDLIASRVINAELDRRGVQETMTDNVHGLIQTARGACSDEEPHVVIDALLSSAVDVAKALEAERDGLRAEVQRLRQGLWDENERLRTALGDALAHAKRARFTGMFYEDGTPAEDYPINDFNAEAQRLRVIAEEARDA